MHLPSTTSIGRIAAAVLGLSLTAVFPAHADTVDPTLPRTVVVGAPSGAAPSERIDPRRSGRARTRLPAAPVEVWRRHVAGTVEVSPIVDEAGNIIVALSNAELVKLGPDARELWRFRLGGASAVTPPTLLADGTIAVVTAAGTAMGITRSGSLRFTTSLGIARRDADTVPIALENGGFLVAAGSTVVELDPDGIVRARGTLDDRGSTAPERATGAVVDSPAGALVTTASGAVFRFRPPALPRRVGTFGGYPTRGAMLADDRTLVAVVDGRRLVALDLPTGTTHVRGSGVVFDAPPALGPGGLLIAATQLGLLLGIDAAGNERIHLSLDKSSSPIGVTTPSGSFIAAADVKPSPPVIVDESGRIAFVRANGRAGVVSPEGKIVPMAERICASPIALVPAGEKRVLVACRDGGLWMYGE
ncbi:Hypothetical protein A7982_10411 [Minicystis rosea]|nr:Hypothetical protein A7982_10411 [Minicystis rosea]